MCIQFYYVNWNAKKKAHKEKSAEAYQIQTNLVKPDF